MFGNNFYHWRMIALVSHSSFFCEQAHTGSSGLGPAHSWSRVSCLVPWWVALRFPFSLALRAFRGHCLLQEISFSVMSTFGLSWQMPAGSFPLHPASYWYSEILPICSKARQTGNMKRALTNCNHVLFLKTVTVADGYMSFRRELVFYRNEFTHILNGDRSFGTKCYSLEMNSHSYDDMSFCSKMVSNRNTFICIWLYELFKWIGILQEWIHTHMENWVFCSKLVLYKEEPHAHGFESFWNEFYRVSLSMWSLPNTSTGLHPQEGYSTPQVDLNGSCYGILGPWGSSEDISIEWVWTWGLESWRKQPSVDSGSLWIRVLASVDDVVMMWAVGLGEKKRETLARASRREQNTPQTQQDGMM